MYKLLLAWVRPPAFSDVSFKMVAKVFIGSTWKSWGEVLTSQGSLTIIQNGNSQNSLKL